MDGPTNESRTIQSVSDSLRFQVEKRGHVLYNKGMISVTAQNQTFSSLSLSLGC